LLAVSGTHLVFAVLGIVRAISFLLVRIERLAARVDVGRIAAALGAVLAPAYADFAGGSGSARRAAWMLTTGLCVRAAGRHPSATRSFAVSVGVGAAIDPLVGFDVSFVLSAAATAGLLGLGAPLARRLAPAGVSAPRRWLVTSLVATVAAMLPCTPILATLGPTLTLAGIIANIAAAPFGEVVSLPLCLLHAIVPVANVERGIALVASGALLVVRWLARASAGATWLAVSVPPPSAWHFAVLGVGALGLALGAGMQGMAGRRVWLAGTTLGVGLVEWASLRAGHPRQMLRVTVLDVGQGDASLVDLPSGELMLVDGGGFVGSPVDPGASIILPILRARRRNRIDVAVLTHPHPDHFLGLGTVLRAMNVGELWDTGQGRAQGAGQEYAGMMDDLVRRRLPVRGPDELCGPPRLVGGVVVQVLAPCPGFDPVLGPNDNSFVLRIVHGRRSVLLTGDAEHEEEAQLLAFHALDLSADLLKVGHHGSRTSTSPALLLAVRPVVATISCGVRNRFGHPHPDTLSTLARAGVAALRTDLCGSVEFVTDGLMVRSRTFGATLRDRRAAELW
jgi:competence protein ComEC